MLKVAMNSEKCREEKKYSVDESEEDNSIETAFIKKDASEFYKLKAETYKERLKQQET